MTELEKFNKIKLDLVLLKKFPQNLKRRLYVSKFLTKKLLQELIHKHNFSLNYIANKIFAPKGYITSTSSLLTYFRKFKIKTFGMKYQANNPNTRNQYKNTCLKKYGSINALSKNTKAYKKRNKSVKEKYGVENVFQLESVKNKSLKTLMQRHGVSSPVYMSSYKGNNGRKSKQQIIIENYLKSQDIIFDSEKPDMFLKFNKTLNKNYCPRPDILLKDKKIAIEIYGNLWHGNLKIYKNSDLIPAWGGLTSVQEKRKFDSIRKKHIESFGYKVLIFWELDINKNLDKIKKTIDENCKN